MRSRPDGVYRKPGIPVHLEIRIDSKLRNVGFLALSGHSVEYAVQQVGSEIQGFAYPYHGTKPIGLHGCEDRGVLPVLVDEGLG